MSSERKCSGDAAEESALAFLASVSRECDEPPSGALSSGPFIVGGSGMGVDGPGGPCQWCCWPVIDFAEEVLDPTSCGTCLAAA